jgi:hypothetical protein
MPNRTQVIAAGAARTWGTRKNGAGGKRLAHSHQPKIPSVLLQLKRESIFPN